MSRTFATLTRVILQILICGSLLVPLVSAEELSTHASVFSR